MGRATVPYSGTGKFTPARYRNLEPFFAHPIVAKLCNLTDIRTRGADGDPITDLADICDYNEMLIIQAENQRRAQKASEKKGKRK